MAGMDPNVKSQYEDEEEEWDIDDEEKISMVKAIFKSLVIPSYSATYKKKETPTWYACSIRDLIQDIGIPIERLLSSPKNVSHLIEKLMKQEDIRAQIGNLYLQHKFSGLINHHIS